MPLLSDRWHIDCNSALPYPSVVPPRDSSKPLKDRPVDDAGASAPSYATAGVDLDRDEGFIDEIKEITRSTLRPEVLSSVGGFAGLFKAPERYKNPVFVAGADGVGTKLKLAAQLGRYDTVGIDCVAMVVNDLIVQGGEPLVFLDYLAMDNLNPEIARDALRGVAEGCRRAGCALLGGETASMPGVYPKDEIELVGFGVGVVERDQLVDGSSISQGDAILGLASSGCHSNGYSLVRSIIDRGIAAGQMDLRSEVEELNTSLAGALLTPTRIYVKPVLNVMRDFTLKGIVHVTGGGFPGNIPRVLPKGVRAQIDTGSWPRPSIFGFLQRHGEISEDEMLRVFNCGIGLIVIIAREDADDVMQRFQALGERVYRIGEIEVKATPDDPALVLDKARSADV
ncbi:MAG: phosphoribosylformylglycinamidine cyclo-ligase [Deltaproteobacteria bacterium]|nr:MAG: phosphoribosylformylglycinamidine cyclo-ligase [Deltaproteobacteria bacterium]